MKLPELPQTNLVLHMPASRYEREWTSSMDGYDEYQMHAYAKKYAAAQNAQLREALQYFVDEVIDNEDSHDNLMRAYDKAAAALKGQP